MNILIETKYKEGDKLYYTYNSDIRETIIKDVTILIHRYSDPKKENTFDTWYTIPRGIFNMMDQVKEGDLQSKGFYSSKEELVKRIINQL